MPSCYLQSGDYAAYGASSSTTAAQVTVASNLIDGYLYRREGLIWNPDVNGNPCYMAALEPSVSVQSTQEITPGLNVNLNVTGAFLAIQPGFVCILDRLNPLLTEACIVGAVTVNSNNTGAVVQLKSVQYTHAVNSALEFGLTCYEEIQMAQGRPLKNMSKKPVQVVLAGQGRYGYQRRGTSSVNINVYDLLATVTMFGGPPIWEIFDQTLVGVNPQTGQLWMPAGILMAYYTQIRLFYIAGYTYGSLPSAIKQACANVVNASINFPLNGAIINQRAGDTAFTRASATNFDNDTKTLLNPYVASIYA
jgi:hypothetical protein